MHYLFKFNKAAVVVSIFQPINSILRDMLRTAGDITDQTQTYCKQTKLKQVWFNAIFATLYKGMKSCANVLKCGRRTEALMEKEPQQTKCLRNQGRT